MPSLSLDFTAMLTIAFQLMNGLWPVFVYPLALAVGIGLLGKIIAEVRSLLGH
jgi:hypothetical protein